LESNAKLWYEQTSSDVLSTFWGKDKPNDAAIEAMRRIGKSQKSGKDDPEARELRWKELVSILESLEEAHGWKSMDGTEAYTKDENPEHKSMVLGEGWRKF